MSTPEFDLMPVSQLDTPEHPLFVDSGARHAGTPEAYDAERQEVQDKIDAYRAEGGIDWHNSPEQQAFREDVAARTAQILDRHSLPELVTGEEPTAVRMTTVRTRTKESVSAAVENSKAITISGIDEEWLGTMLRSVELYGNDVVHHFDDVKDNQLESSVEQLRAVVVRKHNMHPAISNFVNLSLKEAQQLEVETNARREAVHKAKNSDTTFAAPDEVVDIWKGMKSHVESLPQSDHIDGMTLTLTLWSLSSMTVRGPEDADRKAAEFALAELQQVATEQQSNIFIEPELRDSEFTDILPHAVGELAMSHIRAD